MNRRTLFKTVAAGMAWLAGKKLPAVGTPGQCSWHVCNYVTVRNLSGNQLLPKRIVYWTRDRSGVTDAPGVMAGVVDDSCPADGFVTIQTYGGCQIELAS